ncbi:2-oxo acid dehydrogenase subunit E2 [Marinilongibacter aquaticus]|uniref:2-oxo acid dehydrogenase subunit E2 n=1 Tax=Marinilongibacter aquaticus TaxID=2975157 RepID=UPI0021BD0F7F|nr:2-oxo acid dehydrogenase subunit E2 [Marinilongibacter aquaticus]UBM60601.1 2-oxo acid dehydrogenase subunit E2 [Marinilongibacter aquaticus]
MSAQGKLNNSWRKTAATIYRKPDDSKIFGSVDLDITELYDYVFRKRSEGLKITFTHIFVLAAARAIREEIPELNTYIKRGNVHTHPQIDASISVLLRENEMGSVKIEEADKHSLYTLAPLLREKIQIARKGLESNTMQMKDKMAAIPWPFREVVFRIIKKVMVGLGLPLGKLSANSFGSFIISNIGTLGLDTGYPALFPVANMAFVLIMGRIQKKALVVNKQVEIRRVITLSAAMDHRMVDASHAGILFRHFKKIARNPEQLEISRP